MALETLKNITKINDFSLVDMGKLKVTHPEKFEENGRMDYQWFEEKIRPHNFIYVRHDVNSLSFTLQNGPIKENGINGCQVDEIIEAAKQILLGLNANYPCKENACAITHLEEAGMWLNKRKQDRIKRDVEGQNKI
ncbi:MAG: hypothetical protein QM489_00515 [Candidatus Izemoplasma sp.]